MSVRPPDSRESLFVPFPKDPEYEQPYWDAREKKEYDDFFTTRNEFETEALKRVVGPNPRLEEELESSTLIQPLRRLVVDYLMPDPKVVAYYVSKIWPRINQINHNDDLNDPYRIVLHQRLLMQFAKPSSMLHNLKDAWRFFQGTTQYMRYAFREKEYIESALRGITVIPGILYGLWVNRKAVLWETPELRDTAVGLDWNNPKSRYFLMKKENPEAMKELEKCRSLFEADSEGSKWRMLGAEDAVVKEGQDEYDSQVCRAREYFICRKLNTFPKPTIEEETNFNSALAKLAVSELSQKASQDYGPAARIKKFVKRFSPY